MLRPLHGPSGIYKGHGSGVTMFHSQGIRMLRYLDDWLILASTHQEALQVRDAVLQLCSQLEIVVILEKLCLNPSQTATYLGMVLVSPSLRAFPTEKRVSAVCTQIEEFLSYRQPSELIWRCLLGRLAFLCHLVPVGHLRMRSLQLKLREHWDFAGEEVMVPWAPAIQCDLKCWYDAHHLLAGASLLVPQLDILFWSDASDQGWGAHMLSHFILGLWSPKERTLSINLRELRAIRLGLLHFRHLLVGLNIGVFSDNTTALSYICKGGGTVSSLLSQEAQLLLRWAESPPVSLVPQFVRGSGNVVADSLNRRNQVVGLEWTLHQDVVNALLWRWPATVDLFATSLNHRLPVFFSPINNPMTAASNAFLQSWDGMPAYAFPLFALVREVLNKVVSSRNLLLTLVAP